MNVTILLFGILRDVIGENSLKREVAGDTSVEDLRENLAKEFPDLRNYKNYSVAVNEEYAAANYSLKANDVIALIPPVSGG